MNKKILTPLILIVLLLIILIFIMNMFNIFSPKKYKIAEIKKFPAIAGFTFDYPVFKNCEIEKFSMIGESFNTGALEFQEMKGFINCPVKLAPGGAPYLSVKKQKLLGLEFLKGKDITEENIKHREAPSPNVKRNSENVLYDYYPEDNFLQFYGEDFGVEIKLVSVPEGIGFSSEEFFKKVIESFAFLSNVSQEEALKIAIEYSNFKGTSLSDLEEMQKKIEEKENHYEIFISPVEGRQNFDIYITIDKKTGVVTNAVFGAIEE